MSEDDLKPNQYGEPASEDCRAGRHEACGEGFCLCICHDDEAFSDVPASEGEDMIG